MEKDAYKLIQAHDGATALLYIWLSANNRYNAEKAAADMCMTLQEVENAKEKLQRMGIFHSAQDASAPAANTAYPEPAEQLPEYSMQEIASRAKTNGDFSAIVNETVRVIGHELSPTELTKLFGIYDHLALPAEVIFELVNYCADMTREKFGLSRRLSFAMVEKEAYYWANHEIVTLEAAEDHIRSRKRMNDASERIKRLFGITDRKLTSTEREYIEKWVSLGFDDGSLAEAYDRTVTNTGKLSWPYLNKIVLKWDEKGLHNLSDILAKDSRTASSKAISGSEKIDYSAARRLMESSRNENGI